MTASATAPESFTARRPVEVARGAGSGGSGRGRRAACIAAPGMALLDASDEIAPGQVFRIGPSSLSRRETVLHAAPEERST